MRAPRAVAVRIVGRDLPGVVCGPHQGVTVGLQVRKDTVGAVPGDADEPVWEATIGLAHDEEWAFRGAAVHGPKGDKHFYLVWSEQIAGVPSMFRRAKLMLTAVPEEVLATAWESGELIARVGLTDGRGMPLCAAVRPPRVVWSSIGG